MNDDTSRREFLLTSASALLFGGCASQNKKPCPFIWGKPRGDAEIDCLVLGAGLSGLTTARHIVEGGRKNGKDLSVVVLEGDKRIGGRIQTIKSSNHYQNVPSAYDTGSSYIHRARGSVPLWGDIEKLGVPTEDIPKMGNALLYHPEIGLRSLQGAAIAWDPLEAASIFDKVGRIEGKDLSGAEFLKREGYEGLGWDFVNMMLTGHLPSRIEDISMKGFASDDVATQLREKIEYAIPGGSDILIKKMAEGLDIRKNKEIIEINWRNPSGNITVSTKEGETYEAKSAVCTFSIGMLKSGEVKFNPDLPQIKQQALKGVDMGYMAKAFLRFEDRFWPEDACMIHRPDQQRRAGRTYFVQQYGHPDAEPALAALLHSTDAIKIAGMNPTAALEAICSDLDEIFPEAAPTINRVQRKGWGPHQGIKIKDWGRDHFAKGGNSYLKVDPEKRVPVELVRTILADARTTPGLFWAGEGTAIVIPEEGGVQASSIHGAHQAGARAAQEVLEYQDNGRVLNPYSSSRLIAT
tara:strand:+ start:1054 stop:2619 length:1566 start_codon:yes stop_codon:yes gene_type:complete